MGLLLQARLLVFEMHLMHFFFWIHYLTHIFLVIGLLSKIFCLIFVLVYCKLFYSQFELLIFTLLDKFAGLLQNQEQNKIVFIYYHFVNSTYFFWSVVKTSFWFRFFCIFQFVFQHWFQTKLFHQLILGFCILISCYLLSLLDLLW